MVIKRKKKKKLPGIEEPDNKLLRALKKPEQGMTVRTEEERLKPKPKPEPTGKMEIFRDEKTGSLSGVRTPTGKVMLGMNPQEVREMAKRHEQRTALPPGTVGVAEAQQERREIQKQEGIKQEQARMIEEERPERRELDPETRPFEDQPVIGGMLAVAPNILANALEKGYISKPIGDVLESIGIQVQKTTGLFNQEFTPVQAETLRTAALTEIERLEFEKGLSESESFGALVEGIPIVGQAAAKYSGGLIETPSENIDTILRRIRAERGRGTQKQSKASRGLISPQQATTEISEIEDTIQEMESRIKMLINMSPELRFNSDGVDRIETEILRTREILHDAKLLALQGELTNPTDAEIYFTLEELNEE